MSFVIIMTILVLQGKSNQKNN